MKSVNEILQQMKDSGLSDKASGNLRTAELTELYAMDFNKFDLIAACIDYGFYRGMQSQKRANKQK